MDKKTDSMTQNPKSNDPAQKRYLKQILYKPLRKAALLKEEQDRFGGVMSVTYRHRSSLLYGGKNGICMPFEGYN